MKILKIAIMVALSLLLFDVLATAQNSLKRTWREALSDVWLLFENLDPVNEWQAMVKMGGRWGVADIQGHIVIPAIYEKIYPFPKGRFSFPPCYLFSMDGRRAALLWYKKEDKIGFLTQKMQLIPAEYDEFEVIDSVNLRLYKGSDRYVLQRDGQLTLNPK